MLSEWQSNKIGGTVFASYFFERVFQGVEPIFADLYMELHDVPLPIVDKRDQAYAEHGVIPFTEERIVVPVLQHTGDGLMCLQLDVKAVAFQPQCGSA